MQHGPCFLGLFIMSLMVLLMVAPMAMAQPTAEQRAEDEAFFEGMSPEEVAWYQSIRDRRLRTRDYMAYVKDDPSLPRVLLIGDSISMGYTVPVREMLEGKANVHRIPANGGETARGVQNLDAWLGDGDWDVIHFNFGIHEAKRLKDGKWDIEGEPVSNPELYEKNLRELVTRLKATGATLIWAQTTHIPEGTTVPAGAEVELNAIARRVMNENDVPINDLHAHLDKKLDEHQLEANVHFDEAGYRYLAEAVAAHIVEALPVEKSQE